MAPVADADAFPVFFLKREPVGGSHGCIEARIKPLDKVSERRLQMTPKQQAPYLAKARLQPRPHGAAIASDERLAEEKADFLASRPTSRRALYQLLRHTGVLGGEREVARNGRRREGPLQPPGRVELGFLAYFYHQVGASAVMSSRAASGPWARSGPMCLGGEGRVRRDGLPHAGRGPLARGHAWRRSPVVSKGRGRLLHVPALQLR